MCGNCEIASYTTSGYTSYYYLGSAFDGNELDSKHLR